ncbi:sulfotransferase domain-containing protein [Rubripirellula sp.]|nr:sulfotransferase domain-containing protein [Rubripirellula sp.]MDB4621997.1 sulfotransferase domain-containing protein [Rubripirellula sp.]
MTWFFGMTIIVICTFTKAGTTWVQQIIALLLFEADPDLAVAEMSPWMDFRLPSSAEGGEASDD